MLLPRLITFKACFYYFCSNMRHFYDIYFSTSDDGIVLVVITIVLCYAEVVSYFQQSVFIVYDIAFFIFVSRQLVSVKSPLLYSCF